jgi:carbamoyl-phosphate synthase small subunit
LESSTIQSPLPWTNTGYLLLEDGTVFNGLPFGWRGVRFGEAVFSTGMVGYQEALSDPSYCGQILTLTVPHVGNYGVNPEDVESRKLHLAGFIVTSYSRLHSNWRARGTLQDMLRANEVPGLEGVDTRALVIHLRTNGAMKAAVVTDGTPPEVIRPQLASYAGIDAVDLTKRVTVESPEPFVLESMETPPIPVRKCARAFRVAAIDYGIKRNIVRNLAWRGCHVTVFPSNTDARDILDFDPDGVFLSNGPGNPAMVSAGIATVQRLLKERDLPIFGICLGHQILALALGAHTMKLPFGHRGTNHPVKNVKSGRVWITSQNHGFAVNPDGLPQDLEITHISLHDQTIEGMKLRDRPVFSVQFHPEASPGPRDALTLFDRFVENMEAADEIRGRSDSARRNAGKEITDAT